MAVTRHLEAESAATAPAWPEQGAWTYADWLRLPSDGTRYEIIDGELHVTPPPSIGHQQSCGRLYRSMADHADASAAGTVFISPVAVRLPGQPVPVQPDVLFVSAARRDIVGVQYIEGAPDLVVEVLSPGNWMYDRNEKFRLYRDAGVPEYWIVDYRAKTVEVFALEEGEYALHGRWGSGQTAMSLVLEGFGVAVDEVFGGI